MDLLFLCGGQQFVWDTEKASINLNKHGIAFEKACQVFFDPFVRLEEASDEGEPRSAAIGLSEDWSMLVRGSHVARRGFHSNRLSAARDSAGKEIV